MKLIPTTKLGKWSALLFAAYVLLFMFTTVVVIGFLHQTGGETLTGNLFISIPMLSVFVMAITAFIIAIVSMWKQRERSLLVLVPIIFGVLITLFLVGEVVSPH